jgi:hypothetical protein
MTSSLRGDDPPAGHSTLAKSENTLGSGGGRMKDAGEAAKLTSGLAYGSDKSILPAPSAECSRVNFSRGSGCSSVTF